MSQKNDAYSEMLSALAKKTRDDGFKPTSDYVIQKTLEAQQALNAQLSYKPGTLLTAEMVRAAREAEWATIYGKDLHDDKLDALSSGAQLHKDMEAYIARNKSKVTNVNAAEIEARIMAKTNFAALSPAQVGYWNRKTWDVTTLTPSEEEMLLAAYRKAYPNIINTINKEPAMTSIKIETKTFVTAPGFKDIDVTKLTPGDLAAAINSIDGEIARFETLSVKPASVIAHIAQLKQGLADLVAAVDKANPSVPQPTE